LKRDLRAYARQTNVRLVIGAVLLIFVVGIALIYIFYGGGAALTGFLCLLGSLVPIALIFLAIQVMDWIITRARPK
jgi:hypothetical protein